MNADLGEGAGHDDELLDLVSSANIASGFHAGDADSMREAIRAAHKRGVAVGAHPSFFDREHFGRREMPVSPDEVFEAVAYQLGIFEAIAQALNVRPVHFKPHGALYNMATRERPVADAIVEAAVSIDPALILFAPPGSQLTAAATARRVRVAREFFADRNYMNDGSLVSRTRPDALLHDPEAAAARVVRVLREGKVRSIENVDATVQADTICVHGDTPGAVEFVRALRAKLEAEHVRIQAPVFPP